MLLWCEPHERTLTRAQGEPPAQLQQASVPTRRHSLVQNQRPTVPPPGAGIDQPRPNGAQYNGYSRPERSERLPLISSHDEGAFTRMPVPHVPPPQQRSVSATSASSTATVTNVPPRSRSLHHPAGPGKISVRIPSPTLGGSSLLPFPEAPGSEVRGPSPPPDYQRAMSAIDLSSERGTPYGDTSGLPRSSNLGGPWEPSGNDDYFGSGEFTPAPRARHARTHARTHIPRHCDTMC